MYPRNAASPERILVGQVVLIADGTVQSSGVAITIRKQGGSELTGVGTISYGVDNSVYYTPTQAETNATSFVIIASKASCFSASQTIVTTASSVSGNVVLAAQTHTGAIVPTVSTLTGHTPQTGDNYLGSTAKANITSMYDGTGLTGDEYPAKQSQVTTIANVGSATNAAAASFTLTTGTQTSNTYTATEALDGVRHTLTSTAGAFEGYYEFTIGGGTPSSVKVTGALTGSNDDLLVYGYNWISTSWVQIGTFNGTNSSINRVDDYDMFTSMVGSGANEGKVRVRFYAVSGLTSATLYIDQIFVGYSQGVEGYDNGAVWFNSNVTNTSTVPNIDGTARNPVSTHTALMTLLASTGLNKVEVTPSSTLTLGEAMEGYTVNGNGSALVLGSQNIGGTVWSRFSIVTGVGTTSANPCFFEDCQFGTVTVPPSTHYSCGYGVGSGIMSLGGAGDYTINDGLSKVAGSGSPQFTRTGSGVVTVQQRRFSGGTTHNGITGSDTYTVGGELGTVTLNGASGTVEIRGTYKAVTDNRTGSPTLNTEGAVTGADVEAILVDTGTTIPAQITALNDFNPTTDTVANVTTVGTTTNVTSGVVVTTNNDKSGYSLTQTFPANFSSLSIDGSGNVDSYTQGYISTAISEATVGNISNNFDTFFDNTDSLTSKVVDDVGTAVSGGGEFTATEKSQMRHRLGIDGTAVIPTASPDLSQKSDISALNDFNPSTDTVANVTLVATTTDLTNGGGGGGATPAEIWSYATRELTSGNNIVLSKGTGVTGFNDVAATDIVTGGAINTTGGAIDSVTLVDTTTTNTDMRGTNSAFLASSFIAPDNASIASILVDTSTTIPNQISGLNDLSATEVWTTQLTESYAADGVAPTATQALMLTQQFLTEFDITTTSYNVKRLDGTNTAATFTLNDDTNPTSITRS